MVEAGFKKFCQLVLVTFTQFYLVRSSDHDAWFDRKVTRKRAKLNVEQNHKLVTENFFLPFEWKPEIETEKFARGKLLHFVKHAQLTV